MTQQNEPHEDPGENGGRDNGNGERDASPQDAAPESVPEEKTGEENRIAALEAELAQAKDKMLRAVAEEDNTRKRLLRDREEVRKYAVSDFARDMLAFADNFRRAFDSIPPDLKNADERIKGVLEGIEAMEKELLSTFERHGIEKMEPLGEPFDPNFHEVMFEAPDGSKPPGTIVQIIEPGYVLHDRLLRPARVGVAKDGGPGDGPLSPGKPGGQIDQEA